MKLQDAAVRVGRRRKAVGVLTKRECPAKGAQPVRGRRERRERHEWS